MELSNTFEVKAPIEEAWTKLTDLELIAPAMPGAQGGSGRYPMVDRW